MDEKRIIEYMTKKRYVDGKYICWDFVMDVFKDCYGIDLPEYPVDEIQVDFRKRLIANFEHEKIAKGWEREGDIIAFSLLSNQHAGVMINDKDFIHLSRDGVGIVSLKSLLGNYQIYRVPLC